MSVSYATQDLGAAEEVAGMKVYNALGGADYDQATGMIHFASGVVGYLFIQYNQFISTFRGGMLWS